MAAKDKKDGDGIKGATKVASEKELPSGGTWVTDEATGKKYYEVTKKHDNPKSKTPSGKAPVDEKKTVALRKGTTKPHTPTKTDPSKKPSVPQSEVQRYYLETPPPPVPLKKTPVDLENEMFQGLNYEGKRQRKFEAEYDLPKVSFDGKTAPIMAWEIPAKFDPKTNTWDSSSGTFDPQIVYGVQDPTSGKFTTVDLNMTPVSTVDNMPVYKSTDLINYGPQMQMDKALKHGAIKSIQDKAYMESLGPKVKEREGNISIGTINQQGTGFGKLEDVSKKDLPPLSGFKKGGIVGKYAKGGPMYSPTLTDITKYTNQLNKSQGVDPNVVTDVTTPETVTTPDTKSNSLFSGFKALPGAQKASIYGAAGEITGTGVDLLDRKDGRSSIAGQAGVSALKGAGRGAALGSSFGPVGTGIGAGVGLLVGAGFGAARGKKEKQERIQATADEASTNAVNAGFDPSNPNKVFKLENYNEKDYKKGFRGLFAKGGKIVGNGTGTSDDVSAKLKSGSFIVPAKNEKVAATIRKNVLGDNSTAQLNDKGGVPVKVSNGEHLFTPEEVSELTAKGIDLDKLAPEAKTKLREEHKFKCGGMMKYADGGKTGGDSYEAKLKRHYDKMSKDYERLKNDPKHISEANKLKRELSSAGYYKPKGIASKYASSDAALLKKLQPNTAINYDPAEEEIVVPEAIVSRTPGERNVTVDPIAATQLVNNRSTGVTPTSTTSGSKFGWQDAVGLGLSGAQTGYGIQQLLKDKRPIGTIDPDFDRATNQALLQSKYGYSPEQAALLNNQITQGRVSQTANINAISGGNAAVGLTNSRAAINNEVANRLKLASEDERLRMQKQQYANQLVGQRAGMRRQLFQDKMNQFMQNQEAGAALLGSGLSNLVSASRYNQEKQAQDQINKTMYGYLNNIPK